MYNNRRFFFQTCQKLNLIYLHVLCTMYMNHTQLLNATKIKIHIIDDHQIFNNNHRYECRHQIDKNGELITTYNNVAILQCDKCDNTTKCDNVVDYHKYGF